ncbi:unnamed protein product [Strongylus vulgaris]|uniref:Uncharacterized protein n=1 Tax=Strongylus vulgaris TaxID=40348 RepID=A0A3P7ILK8_STRVU|nr:unnamed protein product [Strongylus vulgaris]
MLRRRSLRSFTIVLAVASLNLLAVCGFNLDVYAPIYKYGQENTYFGYTVAEHFKVDEPVMHEVVTSQAVGIDVIRLVCFPTYSHSSFYEPIR